MADLRKRKSSTIDSETARPFKKNKLNDEIPIDSFLAESDIDSIHSEAERKEIDNIINEVIEQEQNEQELEFAEVSNDENNEDDFLELDDADGSDNVLQQLSFLEDIKKKQIASDIKQDIYEEKRANDAMARSEISFVFPSYKRLLKEKTETPKLDILKERIESVLSILSNFSVLRDENCKHSRREYISLLSHSMSRYYGYNLDLMNMFLTIFNPNECLAFLEANEESRPLTIRTNTLKCRRRDLAKLLIARGVDLDPLASWTKTGLKILNHNIPIGATPEYLSGYYMIQSAASLLPTLALGLKGGMKVLDMCSAPGGKTTHIAQILRDAKSSVVVANDVNGERLKAVYGNIHRMGFKNVVICNMDGRQLHNYFDHRFDRVLLDAPCSCLGIISRDPSIKFSKKFQDVTKMSTLQQELILTAIDCCQVGGYVVYSTCSISPYENELVVDHACNKRYVKVVETGLPFGENGFSKFKHLRFAKDMNKTRRYYPHIHNLDGFFVAKLYKCDKGKRGVK